MNPMDFLNDDKLSNEEKLRRYFLESGKLPYDNREAAQAAAEEQKSGMGIGQALAGLGASMAGRAPSASLDYFDKRKQAIDEATVGAYDKSSKEQSDRVAEYLKNKYAMDLRSQERQDMKDERAQARQEARADRALAREAQAMNRDVTFQQKQEEKKDKQKQLMSEVEDRRQNIDYNLDKLNKMVDEYGTYEMFGSHNQDMDRLIDQVATDMAKLSDPSSVARPSEVDAVKRNLIQSGFQNSNATAKKIIQNFKDEVNQRANLAYKVRGLEAPQQAQPQSQKKEVRRQRNKETGEIRVTYDDGSTQILGGK